MDTPEDGGFAWAPLDTEEPTAPSDAGAGVELGKEREAAQHGQAGAAERPASRAEQAGGGNAARSSRTGSSWKQVAESVRGLKHDVDCARAEIKSDIMDASKKMREMKAQLSQLLHQEAERVRGAKLAEQSEREAISRSAAALLLEQEDPVAPEAEVVRKSAGSSRAATPDKVDGWTENELPLVTRPLSPAERLRDDGTVSPERPRSRGKSPPRSPTRTGAAPWVNTEVDDAPLSPDPDGPDGIDGGRFPRLPLSPTPPRLARPPSADASENEEPVTQSKGDTNALIGNVALAPDEAAAAASSDDGDAHVREGQRSTAQKPRATLTQIQVGEQAVERWGFPDQFFASLPRADAGGATSNMMPVTTGGYEFRPNLGARDDRDSFAGGPTPYLERDIAIITKHQMKERERRARSRLQSRQQRRERRHREEYSSRDEHMGASGVPRLPRTPPHSGATFVGGEPIAPRPSSVSSMSHTPDSAALSNLAVVPRPSSRGVYSALAFPFAPPNRISDMRFIVVADGIARTGGLLWGESSPPLSPVSAAVRKAMAHGEVNASDSGALVAPLAELGSSRVARRSTSGSSIDWVAIARENARDFRKGSGNPRRQSDYNHPHWSAVARPVTGTRGSPGMSLLERANPANTRSYTLGRWHNRQKRLINETSLFGRYVINPRAAKALGSRSRGELSMYPATLDDKGRFRADSNPGLFDTRLKLG